MRTRCKDHHGVVHVVPTLYTTMVYTACMRVFVWDDASGLDHPHKRAAHTEEKISCLACLAV